MGTCNSWRRKSQGYGNLVYAGGERRPACWIWRPMPLDRGGERCRPPERRRRRLLPTYESIGNGRVGQPVEEIETSDGWVTGTAGGEDVERQPLARGARAWLSGSRRARGQEEAGKKKKKRRGPRRRRQSVTSFRKLLSDRFNAACKIASRKPSPSVHAERLTHVFKLYRCTFT